MARSTFPGCAKVVLEANFGASTWNGKPPASLPLLQLPQTLLDTHAKILFSPQMTNQYNDEPYFEIVRDTLQQIDLTHRIIDHFSRHLQLASSAREVWKNFRDSDRISSLLGAEGLHQIGNSASVLRLYHRLGVRYVTLTHECHNKYADSATPKTALHNGLSEAGTAIIGEMNRIGMIVDLSHTSSSTMHAALNVSLAPVLFSHSSIFDICPHERNVRTDVLLRLKENGGVIMITFYAAYTNCARPGEASIHDVADHIEHVGNLIGYKHVGLGSDFDGMEKGIDGLEDVSKSKRPVGGGS